MKTDFYKAISKIVALFIFSQVAYMQAQVIEQKRIEFDSKDGYSNEQVFAFGNKGFIISSMSDDTKHGKTEVRFELFNTELVSVKSESHDISSKYRFDQVYNTNTHLHTLYGKKRGYSLVSVNASDLSITEVKLKLPKKTSIYDMTILGDFAFFRAYSKKRYFLTSVNWKTGKMNFIPVIISNYNPKKTSINYIQLLDKTNELLVFVKVQVKRKRSELYVINFNSAGEKLGTWHLSNKIDENLIDITGTNIGDGKYVFTGTYSKSELSTSDGLFFCKVDNGKTEFIRFYKFTDLKSFYSYMSKRAQNKIEKKKSRKEKRGKELIISTRIADHEIMQVGNEYLFLGESYYPTYRTETYTTTSMSASGVATTTTHTRTVFDGYQYTNSILVKYDADGHLIWDRSFELWPYYKPFYVKRFISASIENKESINMVFINYNKIVTKSIGLDGTVLKEKQSEGIETGYSGDKAKYTFSNIDYWFDHYFLAYGNQVIKNKEDKSVARKRRVFFVSRVAY